MNVFPVHHDINHTASHNLCAEIHRIGGPLTTEFAWIKTEENTFGWKLVDWVEAEEGIGFIPAYTEQNLFSILPKGLELTNGPTNEVQGIVSFNFDGQLQSENVVWLDYKQISNEWTLGYFRDDFQIANYRYEDRVMFLAFRTDCLANSLAQMIIAFVRKGGVKLEFFPEEFIR